MNPLLVPTDVADALARAGYRPIEVTGAAWLAAPLDGSDQRIELQVVPAVADAALAERAARLCAVRHEHLPQVLDVVELATGRLGLVVEHVAGPTLAQIRAARAPLTDGEAVTVAIPTAGAIEALRHAGLGHGGVSESTVVVRPDGRPVLTDLRGALTGAGDTGSDLRALVTAVLAQLPGADVHRMTGVPGERTVRDTFTGLLTMPGLTADAVVAACYGATDPAPVRLPDAAVLASTALSTVAREAERGRRQGGSRRAARARRGRRALRLGAVAVAVAVVLGGAAIGWRVASREQVSGTDDPVAAAVELSRLRAEVIGAGDPAGLSAVEIVDGPAYHADARLLPSLGGARVEGLVVDVQDAWLVGEDGSRPGTTDVAVTAAMSAHSRVPTGGGTTIDVAASQPRTVVLGLRWTADGWRVWDVVER